MWMEKVIASCRAAGMEGTRQAKMEVWFHMGVGAPGQVCFLPSALSSMLTNGVVGVVERNFLNIKWNEMIEMSLLQPGRMGKDFQKNRQKGSQEECSVVTYTLGTNLQCT